MQIKNCVKVFKAKVIIEGIKVLDNILQPLNIVVEVETDLLEVITLINNVSVDFTEVNNTIENVILLAETLKGYHFMLLSSCWKQRGRCP